MQSKSRKYPCYLRAGFALILWAIFSVNSSAQAVTATIFGTVTDQTGAIIPNAVLSATNVGTGLVSTTKTNGDGVYRIEYLQIGQYTVEATAPGFSHVVQSGIVLEAGRLVKIDAALAPGNATESIEVSAAAPIINTANAEVGTTIENVQVAELPIVNLNPYQMLDIVPGVQSNVMNQTALGLPEQHTQINGGIEAFGSGNVNYFLDGGQNVTSLRNAGNILPSPDSIQEFRVQATNYGADYGRFAGGVINVITKSGSNEFHGTAYEYWRNDRLNGRPWHSSVGNPPMHRNQFGATAGGHILRDKTFFFGSYAGLRETTASFLSGTNVPTTIERNSDGTGYDFSASGQIPTDPFNGKQPFSCNGKLNVICPSYHIDPVAVKFLKSYVPAANLAGGHFWQGYVITPDASDGFLLKIDHKLSTNHQLRGSYFNTSGNQYLNSGGSTLPYTRTLFTWRQHNLNLSDTWTVSNSLINQVWLTYTRAFGARSATIPKSLTDFGSTFVTSGPPSLPYILLSNYFFLGDQISGPMAGNNFYSVRDIVSLSKGKHSLRAGGEVVLNKDAQYTNLRNYGQFNFNGTMTGNGFADFLLGLPSQVIQETPVTPSTNTFITAGFAQDDYRATGRLTVNLGIRWDVQTPPKDPLNRQSTYIPGRTSDVRPGLVPALLFPGDKGIPRGIVDLSWTHIAPRVGFAYDPQGNGKMAIRGGVGMFWGGVSGNNWNTTSNGAPFILSLSFPNAGSITGASLADPYRNYPGGTPFPYSGNYVVTGSNLNTISRNYHWPYTYQLNLSVQRQITGSFAMTVGYVGTLSHNLAYMMDRNYPVASSTATSSAANVLSRRPNPAIGQVWEYTSAIGGNYHALQVVGEKRMTHGLSIQANYVWAKTLVGADVQDYQTAPQDFNNIAAEYGRANTDIRQAVSAGIVWQANYLKNGNRVLRYTANGWQISTIFKANTGMPFTLQNGLDANMDGNLTDRPKLVGDWHLAHPTTSQWFNTAAFVQDKIVVGSPVTGNTPRNLISAPGYIRLDLALQRNFSVFDKAKLQFRAEGNNALNHPNLNGPGNNINSPSSFGIITTASTMRQMQIGAKLQF